VNVLEALAHVDRAAFLPEFQKYLADADLNVPIAAGVTCPSRSYTETVVSLLDLKFNDKVLEVGTGSGYQTAVLSRLCCEVHTCDVEVIPESVLDLLPAHVFVHQEKDGRFPCMQEGEFDAILVTAGAERIYEWWMDILAEGGRMVVPIGKGSHYAVRKFVKTNGVVSDMGDFAYVNVVPLRR
jgi:protein-L-isoaspartate(D-aspartate) O-methyltransferase